MNIPHTGDVLNEEMCSIDYLKKMCSVFLYGNNTVEETFQFLYSLKFVINRDKELEKNRHDYQRMLDSVKSYLIENQSELKSRLYYSEVNYWDYIFCTYNSWFTIKGFDFLTSAVKIVEKEIIESILKKHNADASTEEVEKIQKIVYEIEKSPNQPREFIISWEEPFVSATVRVALCHSEKSGWYTFSNVYCRNPVKIIKPITTLTSEGVTEWIIEFVIKYKMYKTLYSYEKVNTFYLNEALKNGEI